MTRSTEVQMVIVNKGMERGVVTLITELFERMAAQEAHMQDNAMLMLQVIKQLEQVVDGAGAIRKEVEKMQRRGRSGDDDDLPPRAS